MIISKSQLDKWLKIPKNVYELTNTHITEVDSFEENFVNASGLVTGLVLTKEKHPNADTLSLTTVDVGDGVIKNIVCGAPNVEAGQYVVVALIGAVLPGGFEIKDATIRGVASEGMICSLDELQIKNIPAEYQDGIFVFPNEVKLGMPALEALNFEGFVMELDLTPNSGHLLSVLGFAYDLAAITNQTITLPKYQFNEIDKPNPITVKIEDDGCTLYYARYAEVVIKPSPWWLQSELIKRGVDPVNNVVDISNFIMFEYGTPLHMFDADLFGSKKIVIKAATDATIVETLSQQKHQLSKDDLVITNGSNPTAVAGVIGLANSMILPTTKNIIIEAAHFDAARIQNTSKKIGRTDSSLRFERGVDQAVINSALETTCHLLEKYADAKIYQGISKAKTKEIKPITIELSPSYVNKLLGTNFKKAKIIAILKSYQFEVIEDDKTLKVVVPTRRNDIKIAADLVEEIGRLYGYDNIENQPLQTDSTGGKQIIDQKQHHLRTHLSNLGLNEVITYSLIDEKSVHLFNNLGTPYQVLSPLTEERKFMRQSLLNGLLTTYKYNIARQNKSINIFEIGNVYTKESEYPYLAILINSKLAYNLWQKDSNKIDFYTIKGILESLFYQFGATFKYRESTNHSLHPFRQAEIISNNETVGFIGQVHPSLSKDEEVYVLEVSLTSLLQLDSANSYQPVSRYPSIERDIAFVVSKEVLVSDIEAIIWQTARKHLVDLKLFDVYQGDNIPENTRSLAYRLLFNSSDKTLESSDIDKIMKSVINRLNFNFKAEIR